MAGLDPATRPTLATDSDSNGVLNVIDGDDDGDGLADERDETDRGWGIRHAYAVRAAATAPAAALARPSPVARLAARRARHCVWLTDPLPAVASVTAAREWIGRAAARGCLPGGAASAAAKPVSLAKLGVTLKAAALTGTKVSVQARATKSAVKLRFSVLKAKTANRRWRRAARRWPSRRRSGSRRSPSRSTRHPRGRSSFSPSMLPPASARAAAFSR